MPPGFIGITAGLLLTDGPFSFMALIGGLSLIGMMIKNSIAPIDAIRTNETAGIPPPKQKADEPAGSG